MSHISISYLQSQKSPVNNPKAATHLETQSYKSFKNSFSSLKTLNSFNLQCSEFIKMFQ